jgi:serine/threonine protein phosphatase PrpC
MGNTSSRSSIPPDEKPVFTKLDARASVITFQGFRFYMEDDYSFFKDGETTMYAVFDGHGGSGAVQFAKEHLLKTIVQECASGYTETNIATGFITTERKFRDKINTIEPVDKNEGGEKLLNIRIPLHNPDDSGTCAVVAIFHNNKVIIANVGDCQALIVNKDKTTLLQSTLHRCSGPEEIQRIEDANLYVQQNRVLGELAISRSIGDFKYKGMPSVHSTSFDEIKHAVTCIPTFHTFQVTDEMSSLVLFSDGIGDGISYSDIADSLSESSHGIEHIVEVAHKESRDNVSLLLIHLST